MTRSIRALSSFLLLALGTFANYTIFPSNNGLIISDGDSTIVNNSAILSGAFNTTVSSIKNSTIGLTYAFIKPTIAKVQVYTSFAFHGARFSAEKDSHYFGVWEYPFNDQVTNKNISFDLKGVEESPGIRWANARAPFFITSAGYGVYADTLKMGSYHFTTTGDAQFLFNTSNLVYYIILPKAKNDFKSIIEQYTELSARIEMPPTSGLGPTFWSDDFTKDFHGSVSNSQENIYDVVNHLYTNQIRATSIFADRPYGTGDRSWGNFDFDPKFYPDPAGLIKNLTDSGFDFQVWIANRGQPGTELYNKSLSEGWQMRTDVRPSGGLGPALDLSIPAAYDYFADRLKVFTSLGVKGYKIDRGEEGEYPLYLQNEQMSLFLQLAHDTMTQKHGPSNFYNFARSAVDRSRAVTHIWNGDPYADFTGLAYSVASGFRSGLIAFPIWGSDTGGYIRQGEISPSEEVWARWMWFSAFSPVYELMLGTKHTPWYPPYTQQTVDILKQTANLHADLTPYIESYAYDATRTGLPIIRALFLEAPTDGNVWEVADSYFFGEAFLVAPVVNAGGERSVYFPVGPSKSYVEYFNKTSFHTAGTTANITVPISSIPVYVKQGAIIPRGDTFQGNAKWIEDWQPFLTIELFPSWEVPESRFTYFSGEGATGKGVEIVMTVDKESKVLKAEYGDLGIEAAVLWHLKDGPKEVNLNRGGGSTTLRDRDLLF